MTVIQQLTHPIQIHWDIPHHPKHRNNSPSTISRPQQRTLPSNVRPLNTALVELKLCAWTKEIMIKLTISSHPISSRSILHSTLPSTPPHHTPPTSATHPPPNMIRSCTLNQSVFIQSTLLTLHHARKSKSKRIQQTPKSSISRTLWKRAILYNDTLFRRKRNEGNRIKGDRI